MANLRVSISIFPLWFVVCSCRWRRRTNQTAETLSLLLPHQPHPIPFHRQPPINIHNTLEICPVKIQALRVSSSTVTVCRLSPNHLEQSPAIIGKLIPTCYRTNPVVSEWPVHRCDWIGSHKGWRKAGSCIWEDDRWIWKTDWPRQPPPCLYQSSQPGKADLWPRLLWYRQAHSNRGWQSLRDG